MYKIILLMVLYMASNYNNPINILDSTNAVGVGSGGSLNVGGGFSVKKDTFVGGSLSVSGTSTAFADNILVMNQNPISSKDTGILFERYSQDYADEKKFSGLIYTESSDEFVFGYANSDPNTIGVTFGNYIPVKANNLTLMSTSNSLGIGSGGSLTVLGGASISKSLNVDFITTNTVNATLVSSVNYTGGNMSLSGDLIIGGSVVTVNVTTTNVKDINISTGTLNVSDSAYIINATIPTLLNTNVVSTNISSGTLNVLTGITSASVQVTNINAIISTMGTLLNTNQVSTNISTSTLRLNSNNIALGSGTGTNSQGSNSVAVGGNVGQYYQDNFSVAIGWYSGNTSQGSQAVAIGNGAAQNSQGTLALAFGSNAGQNYQGSGAVAMGTGAGQYSQGNSAVAIGFGSGQLSQSSNTVAIGNGAGNTSQGSSAVAIGVNAGRNTQGNSAIAIGNAAGNTSQGISSIAIGPNSGNSSQGNYAVALGNKAGEISQHANSIIINANVTALNSGTVGAFYVNPVRNVVEDNFLGYDTTTKEITYWSANNFTTTNLVATNISSGTLNISTGLTSASARITTNLVAIGNSNTIGSIFTTGGNVGIGTSTPSFTLDVTGIARVSSGITTGGLEVTGLTDTLNLTATNVSFGTLTVSSGFNASAANSTFWIVNATNNISTASILSANQTTTNIVATNISSGTTRVTTSLIAIGNSNTIGSIITTGGNVGIGIASPISPLHVDTNVTVANTIVSTLSSGIGDPLFKLVTQRGVTTNNNGDIIAKIGLNYNYTSDNAFIRFHRGYTVTGGFLSLTTNSDIERMRIDGSGNVGIGTTSPETTLDVTGTARVTTSITTGALYNTNQTSTNIVVTNLTTSNLTLTNPLSLQSYYFVDMIMANYFTSGTTENTTITTGAYTILNSTNGNCTLTGTSDFSKDASLCKITYTGSSSRQVRIDLSISCDFSTFNRHGIYISKYTSATTTTSDLTTPITLVNSGYQLNCGKSCYTTLNTNDYIMVRIYNNGAASSNIRVSSYNLMVTSVS